MAPRCSRQIRTLRRLRHRRPATMHCRRSRRTTSSSVCCCISGPKPMPMPDTSLDLLAKELGAFANRLEREINLRVIAAVAEINRKAAEFELRMAMFEQKAAVIKDGKPGKDGPPGPAGERGEKGEQGEAGVVETINPAVTTLPPELAAEVASAMRMLHETPLVEYSERSTPSRVVRIERDGDGNMVPFYAESQS